MKHKIIWDKSRFELMRNANTEDGYIGVSIAYHDNEWTMLMVEDEKKSKGLLG